MRGKAAAAKYVIAVCSLLVTLFLCYLAIADHLEDRRIARLEAAGIPQGKTYRGRISSYYEGGPINSLTIDKQPEGSGYRFEIRNSSSIAIDAPLLRKVTSPGGEETRTSLWVTVQPTGTGKSQFLSAWDGKNPATVEYEIQDDSDHECSWHWRR